MASTLPNLQLFQSIARHDPESIAVIHSVSGRKFTYGELLSDVAKAKDALHKAAGKESIDGERVAFLVENSYDYVGVSNRSSLNLKSATDCDLSHITFCPRCAWYRAAYVSCFPGSGIAVCDGSE